MALFLIVSLLSAGAAGAAAAPGRALLGAKGAKQDPAPLRCVILPGMGVLNAEGMFWYKDLADKLKQASGVQSILKTMPDPVFARRNYWWDFMKGDLGIDTNTVIVGHSSGAQAAMRWAEKHKVAGLVLVSPASDDQGMWVERNTGWFNEPFDWQTIKKNSGFIMQFTGKNDNLIPYDVQMRVAKMLGAEVHTFDTAGHFLFGDHSKMMDMISDKLKTFAAKRRLGGD